MKDSELLKALIREKFFGTSKCISEPLSSLRPGIPLVNVFYGEGLVLQALPAVFGARIDKEFEVGRIISILDLGMKNCVSKKSTNHNKI